MLDETQEVLTASAAADEPHVRVHGHDGNYEVWLNPDRTPYTGLCIGVGDTRAEAVADAERTLERALSETSLVNGRTGVTRLPQGCTCLQDEICDNCRRAGMYCGRPRPGAHIATGPQPPPQKNGWPGVARLMIEDLKHREAQGQAKYGMVLQPHNGRDPLIDAYQEALDLCQYLRQAIYERYHQ